MSQQAQEGASQIADESSRAFDRETSKNSERSTKKERKKRDQQKEDKLVFYPGYGAHQKTPTDRPLDDSSIKFATTIKNPKWYDKTIGKIKTPNFLKRR